MPAAARSGAAPGAEAVRQTASLLRADLVRRIARTGALDDPAWRAAFEEVPRHLFVPVYYRPTPARGVYTTMRADAPEPELRARWLEGAYEDVPLVTHIAGGGPVSSSSQPSLMAAMLHALDVHDGHSVLEVGTGTGYNAALLAHRLGDRRVVTVDLEDEITGPAREHLESAGYGPAVITGDGALGCEEYAPYDRIMATCAVPGIPAAWLAQTRPGALVLAPLAGGLVRLTVRGPDRADGRFLATPAYFVALRRSETSSGPVAAEAAGIGEEVTAENASNGTEGAGAALASAPQARRRRTGVGPSALENGAFRFLLGLVAGELDVRWSLDAARRIRLVEIAASDGARAGAGTDGTVVEVGPRDLWALVEYAYDVWLGEGRPRRERFGVTVDGGHEWSWLDDPTGELRWPLRNMS